MLLLYIFWYSRKQVCPLLFFFLLWFFFCVVCMLFHPTRLKVKWKWWLRKYWNKNTFLFIKKKNRTKIFITNNLGQTILWYIFWKWHFVFSYFSIIFSLLSIYFLWQSYRAWYMSFILYFHDFVSKIDFFFIILEITK